MNKRYLHHVWRAIRRVSYGYFLVAFVICGSIFVFSYRNNNIGAIRLRDQLLANDKAGTNVEASLAKLRSYTYSHMNASLVGGSNSIYPPIQLTGTYERLVAAEKNRVTAANIQASHDAKTTCNQQYPSAQTGYLLCIQNYEVAHTAVAQSIPDSLYKFDFIAPRWSADVAGWSLVAAVLFLMLFVVRLVLGLWLHYVLKHHE